MSLVDESGRKVGGYGCYVATVNNVYSPINFITNKMWSESRGGVKCVQVKIVVYFENYITYFKDTRLYSYYRLSTF